MSLNSSVTSDNRRIPSPHPASEAAEISHASRRSLRNPFDLELAANTLAGIVGSDHVQHAAEPSTLVVDPGSPEEACEILRLASRNVWRIVPTGGATWLDYRRGDERHSSQFSRSKILLRTTRLANIVEHEPADLVATAGAGITLSDFNAAIGEAGQWLALDPPDDGRASLGGIVATGVGGAQSFGYGLPRSKVLGMSVVLADGRHVRVGGRVVKNVAGYDLGKLFVGSYGTLGLITELTFKLRPRPACEQTIIARSNDYMGLLSAAFSIIAKPLLPVAMELLSPRAALVVGASDDGGDEASYALLCRFAGTEETVAYQTKRALDLIAALSNEAPTDDLRIVEDDSAMWLKLQSQPITSDCALIYRLSVLPGEIASLLSTIRAENSEEYSMWHASIGDGRVRVFDDSSKDTTKRMQMIGGLVRETGHIFLERAPIDVAREIGSSVDEGPAAQVAARIKLELDANNIFGDQLTQ